VVRDLADRIFADADALEREGFTVVSVGADRVLEVITSRDDASEVLSERYGPVTVEVLAETHSVVPATLTGYRVADRELIVYYEQAGELERIDLAEHDDRVEVAVLERVWNGPTAAVGRSTHASVELSEPLE
jgi:hypothetical protein